MQLTRDALLQAQLRAYKYGTIESIHSEWVIFDDDLDEAFSLYDFANEEVQFFIDNQWINGNLQLSSETISLALGQICIEPYMKIRFQKKITHALQELLNSLRDQDFSVLLSTLKEWNYSIYDCFYCHNFSSYLTHKTIRDGVNFLLFDNDDCILSVNHHFFKTIETEKHYFDFLLSTGFKGTYYS